MRKKKVSILLAEDDANLGLLLVDFLETEGFVVQLMTDGEKALESFKNQTFDLCLLDVMMPVMDGFSLAAAIRMKDEKIPVIFLTAKSLKADKLKGYGLGADDYVTKPFDVDELLWKINAVLRRYSKEVKDSDSRLISIGKYSFDIHNQTLIIEGKSKRITEKECELLAFLSTNRNTVVKREALLTNLWGENDYFLGRSLDVFITKIRKYLKDDPTVRIENVFGVGFSLVVEK